MSTRNVLVYETDLDLVCINELVAPLSKEHQEIILDAFENLSNQIKELHEQIYGPEDPDPVCPGCGRRDC